MDIEAIKFMEKIEKAPDKFDYFDYVDFIENLDPELLDANPKKRNIVNEFIQKCEQKL